MKTRDKLELFYQRMGWTVRAFPDRLVAHTVVFGEPMDHQLAIFEAVEGSDPLEFAARLEKHEVSAVVTDIALDAESVSALELIADEIHTFDTWLNRILRSRDVCEALQSDVLGYGAATFVSPRLMPIEPAELFDWAAGTQLPEDTLGRVVLLTGPAGSGKTTIARRVAKEMASRHLSDETSPVPMLIALEDFRSERRWDDLLAAFGRSIGLNEITPEALQFLVNRGRALLVVDGLDEMAERGGVGAATETLRQLATYVAAEGRLLVTARDLYVPQFRKALDLDDATFVHVAGIVGEEYAKLIADRPEAVKQRVARVLHETDFGISGLASNPMFVVHLASAIAEAPDADFQAASGIEVLRKVVSAINEREVNRQDLGLSPSEYEELLGDFALDALRYGLTSEHEDNLVVPDGAPLVRMWLEERLSDSIEGDAQRQKLLDRQLASVRSHPFFDNAVSGEAPVLRFEHPFFRDTCAAFALVDRLTADEKVKDSPRTVGERVTEFVIDALPKTDGPVQHEYPSFLVAKKISDAPSTDGHIDATTLIEDWTGLDLSNLTMIGIRFHETNFTNTRLDGVSFKDCILEHASVSAAYLKDADFRLSRASADTLNELRARGVELLPKELPQEAEPEKMSPFEEYARDSLSAFFRKFIRNEPGQHKRAVRVSAFTRGVPADMGVFTREHLIPRLLQADVIEHVGNVKVYRFNSDFQSVGDDLLFDEQIQESFQAVFDDIVAAAERHARVK